MMRSRSTFRNCAATSAATRLIRTSRSRFARGRSCTGVSCDLLFPAIGCPPVFSLAARSSLPFEQGPDLRDELRRAVGLRKEIISAQLDPARAVALLPLRREQNDRHVLQRLLSPDRFAGRKAVLIRHHDIQADQIRSAVLDLLHALHSVHGNVGFESGTLEQVLKWTPDEGIVIDDEDPGPAHHAPIRRFTTTTVMSSAAAVE